MKRRSNARAARVADTSRPLASRSRLRSRFLDPQRIVGDGLFKELLEGALVEFVAFENVDGAPLIALEPRIEELCRVLEGRAAIEGDLHLALVRVHDEKNPVL